MNRELFHDSIRLPELPECPGPSASPRSTELVWAAIAMGMVGHAAMYGPQVAFLSELFGTRVRYTGASLGYQLASPLSGGIAPLVATALLAWSGGDPWPVGVYLMGMAAVTVVSVWLASETRHSDLTKVEDDRVTS